MTSTNLKVCLIITESDKVLLIKERARSSGTYKWNVVKGTVENEDIYDAAFREAIEEVNVKINLKSSLGVHVKYYGNNKYTVYFAFRAEIIEGIPKLSKANQQAEGEEITEVKWFTVEELKELKEEDFVIDISYLLIGKIINKEEFPLAVVSSSDLSSG